MLFLWCVFLVIVHMIDDKSTKDRSSSPGDAKKRSWEAPPVADVS
jgi:hypothetical protein